MSVEPLVEMAWVVRYQLAEPNYLLVLPGLLYAELREHFPNLRRETDLPLFTHYFLPPLRNLPILQMRDANGKWFVEITPELIILHGQKPYAEWQRVSGWGKHITQIVKSLPFLSITGGGVRYTGFFHSPASMLPANVLIGGEDIRDNLTSFGWQRKREPFTIAFELNHSVDDGGTERLFLQVDTSFSVHEDSVERFIDYMQEGHRITREVLGGEMR